MYLRGASAFIWENEVGGGAALWGRQYRAGLIAGYAFWLVVLGSLPAWIAYQIYRLLEYIAVGIGKLLPRGARTELPTPEPFDKR